LATASRWADGTASRATAVELMEPIHDDDRPPTVKRPLAGLLLAVLLAACAGPSAALYRVEGLALAGPTCPVVPASPLPGQCDPRPVAGAVLVVTDASGHEVARLTTGTDGSFATDLPAGTYTLTPQPAAGLMGVAPPVAFGVSATDHPTALRVEYDTGIR